MGHRLIAVAYGGTIKRLPFGHRRSNHPVKNHINGKIIITSQNHGYVVRSNSLDTKEWLISFTHINDQSIEGLTHKSKPIMSVQFHPDAHPGPMDAFHIFQDFLSLLKSGRTV